MRRVKAFKPLNNIIPEPGMTLNIYMSRPDVGSGIRAYLVIGVSSYYVTLYYPPRLLVVRLKRNEWSHYHAVPYNPTECCAGIRKVIEDNVSLYQRAGMRYNKSHCRKALEVLSRREAQEARQHKGRAA